MRWLSGLFHKQAEEDTLQKENTSYLPEHISEPAFLRHIDTDRHIESVEEPMELWLSNGETVSTLEELALAFTRMKQEHFLQQVSKQKNEFADWLEDAFGEKTLARKIRKTLSKEQTKMLLIAHLKKRHKKKTEELFSVLIKKAREELQGRNVHKAESTMKRLESLLSLDLVKEEYKRNFEYKLRELTIEIKLATLS